MIATDIKMRNRPPENIRYLGKLVKIVVSAVATYFILDWLVTLPAILAPKYEDYSSKSTYRGSPAKLILDTREKEHIQERLNTAVQRPANFAGEYTIDAWVCGHDCTCGAIVNLKTGQVEMLPKICHWNQAGYRLAFRSDSRLIVASGYVDNKGVYGKHYYEFTGDKLRHIYTLTKDRAS